VVKSNFFGGAGSDDGDDDVAVETSSWGGGKGRIAIGRTFPQLAGTRLQGSALLWSNRQNGSAPLSSRDGV
jgi:hypothetical protein